MVNRGHCKVCGTRCAGVFEDEPGTWGARYLPVFPESFSVHEDG